MSFTDAEIGFVIRDYVCAQCYHEFMHFPTGHNKWVAICRNCKTDAEKGGRITVYTAEKMGQRNLTRYRELKEREPRERRDPAQIITELGF